jgi:glycosyltransferase involved in cell wall biosynthesis
MKNILFVHQSADMYGSDKVMFSLVQGIDKAEFHPIVMLPERGPLLDALNAAGITSYALPIVNIGRSMLNTKGIISIPFRLRRSMKQMDLVLKDTKIDIVHSNTLAVLSGALWAWMNNIPHVWHVHEIVTQPAMIGRLFPFLLRLFSAKIVCNSNATRQWILGSQPSLDKRSLVIWNGVVPTDTVDVQAVYNLRRQLGIKDDDILVALVGRINRLKGQGLLVQAAELLWDRGMRNIHYLIVGSSPRNQKHFQERFLSQVEVSKAGSRITVMDFQDDVRTIWHASDIAVVPSTEPEGFGMVAIEAMAARKPVVAAAHGGLTEIVVDRETGLLIEPGNPHALADAVRALALDKEKREIFGSAGLKRLNDKFTLKKYISSFESVYRSLERA